MKKMLNILIAEDHPPDAELVIRELKRSGFAPIWVRVDTEEDFVARLDADLDLVISDCEMPSFSCARALELVQERRVDAPLIIVSGTIGEEAAVELIKAGAADYVMKDRLGRLGIAVQAALDQHRLRKERAQAEQALRVSEERLRFLVNGAGDYAIAMLDSNGTVLTWNTGAVNITGFSPAEMIGKPLDFLYAAEDRRDDLFESELEEAAQKESIDVEGWRHGKNGVRFWGSGAISALVAGGELRGFSVILRDVTSKRRSEVLLRSVLDNALDVIIGADRQGCISSLNRAGEKLFGYNIRELIGRKIGVLMPEPQRSEFALRLASQMGTAPPSASVISGQTKGLRKDGTCFPMEIAFAEYELENERCCTGIMRDMSEHNMLEEQLMQSQKMEAFGQLAGGVAHDFNNLLTVINGYSDVLLKMLPKGTTQWDYISSVKDAGERAGMLTRQLLAFSRKQVLEPKVLDVNSIIQNVAKLLRRLIGEDVQFVTELAPQLHSVLVDPGQLEQVVMNLAVNARDAMPQGGTFSIQTENVELGEGMKQHGTERGGPHVRLRIADTGCGMSPEIKARIFEPFFTTKGQGKGTGLGLATVFGIVSQSGGAIDVQSEVGVGTTFEISLPAADTAAGKAAAAAPAPQEGGTETILLVEDESSVRRVAKMILSDLGYAVHAAADADEAMRLFEELGGKIDLLLTDVIMPRMSGRELSDALHALKPDLRVLYMSGYTDDSIVRHGLSRTDRGFLHKPFNPEKLSRKVREALEQPAS